MEEKNLWYELVITSSEDIYEDVAAFFAGYDIYEIVIYDSEELNKLEDSEIFWDYVDEGLIKDKREILYKAYFEGSKDYYIEIVDELNSFLKSYNTASLLHSRTLDPNEGLDEWKKYFKAFELVEGVRVEPSWEKSEQESSSIIITMDPSGAFGTGTHETTRLCSKLLAELIRSEKPERLSEMKLLDVGTGSGILSILALKLGMGQAVGVEVDENALKIAVENAKTNALSPFFVPKFDGEGYGGPYHVIVANLVCHIILALKDRMEAAMEKHSMIILSGIIDGKEGDIEAAFSPDRYRLVNKVRENDWYAYQYEYLGAPDA